MKRNSFIAVVTICCITLLNQVTAQDISRKDPLVFPSSHPQNGFTQEHTARLPADGEKTYLNSINTKAIIDFKSRLVGVVDEVWQQQPNGGFTATCTKNNIYYVIHYNKRGRWEGTMKGYFEDKMPFEVRDIVKRNYYDYSIHYVNEVETINSHGVPTYMVHIRYKKDAKIMRVREGVMEIWSEMTIQ
jgi:hypothetical protein